MIKSTDYDASWDDGNEELWDEKYKKWEKRDWYDYLESSLSFPFEVKRVEDLNSNPFADNSDKPFSVGHVMEVLGIDSEDEMRGIIISVREGRKKGYVLLADVEVTSKSNKNFWPVREYVVWFANQ